MDKIYSLLGILLGNLPGRTPGPEIDRDEAETNVLLNGRFRDRAGSTEMNSEILPN